MLAKEVRMKHYILACKIDKFVNETHKIIKAPFCNKKKPGLQKYSHAKHNEKHYVYAP